MSSTHTNTENSQACDYIPCTTNRTKDASKRVEIRQCGGCGLTRYCSKECQTSDWKDHKTWCKTWQKAGDGDEGRSWRRLQRRLYVWRRIHLRALKDGLLAFFQLGMRDGYAHRTTALGVTIVYEPQNAVARCMRVERIESLRYDETASQWADSRAQYETQLKTRDRRAFYGAGQVILNVRCEEDLGEPTVLPVVLPITVVDASVPPRSGWEELLALRLHKGAYLEPDIDYQVRDSLIFMCRRNSTQGFKTWNWTQGDEEAGRAEAATRALSPIPFEQLVHTDAFRLFMGPFFDSLQKAGIVDQLREYINRLESRSDDATRTRKENISLGNHYYWMIKYLMFSTPSRFAETESYYHKLMDLSKQIPEMEEKLRRDEEFMFAVCICLANISGKEDEAIKAFERAENAHPEPYKEELVARAHMSRMFRRAGRVAEAEEHEQKAATWIQYHPYSFSGADYREMLRDKNDPHGRNYILEHENTRMVFNNPIEDVVNSPFTMMY